MAKSYEAPEGVDIAAIRNRGKKAALDLMRPGEGTPWEDRGAQGTLKAFLQTCVKSITSPAMLLDHIRRPDTADEARQFAFGCSALWAVSTAIHMTLLHLRRLPLPPQWTFEPTNLYLEITVFSIVTGAAVFLLAVMFANRMYYAMVSTELKNTAPRVLLYNMFCYTLGPSLLAPIPVIGPPAALLFIFIGWCVGGTRRLYISWKGAAVAAVLTLVAALVIAGAGWFVLDFFWDQLLGMAPYIVPPPDLTSGPYGPPK